MASRGEDGGMDRRDFLQLTGIELGGVALGALGANRAVAKGRAQG